MAISLESAWRKWAWASLEAKRLEADINAAIEVQLIGPPLTIDHSAYKPNLKGFSVFVASLREPPAALGCLLADVVNNYRCALDQLAWYLYQRGTAFGALKPGAERQIYFPISDNREKFNEGLSRYLPGIRAADRAIVRQYQPYKRGNRMLPRMVLSRLRDLGSADKHRTAQPIGLRNYTVSLTVPETVDCVVRRVRIMPATLLEVGAEVARVYVTKTGPDPDIAVQGVMGSDVTINDVLWAKNLCSTATAVVAEILGRFENPPANLIDRLTEWS